MELININFLPSDLEGKHKEKKKRSLIIKLTIGAMLLVIIISLGSVVSRFVKSNEQEIISDDLIQAQQKVELLKEQEGFLLTVKQRLAFINKIRAEKSKEVAAFELIDSLIPEGIAISNLGFDRSGNIEISGESLSATVFESFIESLTTPSKNNQTISKVVVDNLSVNQNQTIKFSLKIHSK